MPNWARGSRPAWTATVRGLLGLAGIMVLNPKLVVGYRGISAKIVAGCGFNENLDFSTFSVVAATHGPMLAFEQF
jgi:hypothetical protein